MDTDEVIDENPLVSVIMPAYNSGKFIAESMDSVISQTYPYWELIVIDDGSTDNTEAIVRQYTEKDHRIRYIYQKNQKQGKARNTGIEYSKGELIAFLDSDDLWVPEKLEKQVKTLKSTKADLIYSDGYIFSKKNNHQEVTGVFQTMSGFYSGDVAIDLFLLENRIPILSVLTYKNAIKKAGGFSESLELQNIEDYHLWLKMILQGTVIFGMSEKLVSYRIHELQSTSRDPLSSEKVLVMYRNYLDLPVSFRGSLNKSIKVWSRNWYLNGATNYCSAFKILRKISRIRQVAIIAIITWFSLVVIGLKNSKRVMFRLIKANL